MSKVLAAVCAVGLLAVAAGCGDDGGGDVFLGVDGQSPLPGDRPEEEQPQIPPSPDAVADASIEDVERFWATAYPQQFGQELPPLDEWQAYSSTVPPRQCGPYEMTYYEVANNAFYCALGDFIAYDEEALLPWLWEDFGGFTIGIVMAHEYGHAVQQRVNELDDYATAASVRIEMQADCYAGAWVAWIAAGNSENFAIATEQLNSSIAGMIAIRDLPGDDPNHPAAHGSGFDRVSSFQDGYENGVASCAEYADRHRQGELAITQIPFDAAEYETGGTLPLEDDATSPGTYTLTVDYLNVFYNRVFTEQLGEAWEPVEGLRVVDPQTDSVECGGETLSGPADLEWLSAYCVDENVAIIDGGTMGPELWERLGDFAVAAEIARLWAFAAQQQLGIADGSVEASLQADCMTGYFGGALFPDEQDQTALGRHPQDEDIYLRLSAGDLDEAVMGILAYDSARSDEAGTAFQRTSALRTGVLAGMQGMEGVSGCAEYLPFN